jgi:hypothetical protein
MPKPVTTDRQVAFFDDGDLWRDEEASPPDNPAGWYFRPRGTSAVWIGPFPTADAASVAPLRGDPLKAAQRRVEEWARSRAEPLLDGSASSDRRNLVTGPPRVRPGRDEPAPPVRVSASPVLCGPLREEPKRAADSRKEVPDGASRPSEAASIARQLTLDLGPAPQTAIEDGTRRPLGRKRRAARGERPAATTQEVFTFDAVPAAGEA